MKKWILTFLYINLSTHIHINNKIYDTRMGYIKQKTQNKKYKIKCYI